MQQVYIVPHTHWDREWYFTTQQSQVLLQEALPVIMDELESGALPCFVLDGQSVMLEDYFEVMPHERERVKALVEAGKLQIGPWYTQTDQCVVGAESLVRNLLYGTRDCAPFGGHLQVGYVPDSFGQTEQLPQLFSQFGIKRVVFWRGLWDGISAESEFCWRSRDGSEVVTAVIQHGYGGVKGMAADEEYEQKGLLHIKALAESVRRFNRTEHTMVMGGNDQQPWDSRLPARIAQENQAQQDKHYQLASMNDFFDALDADEQSGNKLHSVTAEMLAGKYSRIHRGIYSTRYDIKKANADIENLITHQLEPVLAIGWSLGMPYPHGLIEKAWKNIMQSHAHDSIGCCNTDPVNAAVKQRFVESMDLCRQQLDIRKRQIAERVAAKQEGEKVVLFNTLPELRSELVEIDIVIPENNRDAFEMVNSQGQSLAFQVLSCQAVNLGSLVQDLGAALKPGQSGDPTLYRYTLILEVEQLPALGYKTVYIRHTATAGVPSVKREVIDSLGDAVLENDSLRVSVDSDGTLTLADKLGGLSMSGLLELVDGGDDGDNYDFSPPIDDWLISTRGQQPNIRIEHGALVSRLYLDYKLTLPANLQERGERKASTLLPISVCLSLAKSAQGLDVVIDVDNQIEDHRLQAVFRTGLKTDVSFADQPFGIIKRSSRPVELDEWESENWTCKPLPLYPMQSFAAINDGKQGLAVIADGIREYEVSMEDTGDLALTLYRCVGRLGKPNLLYRPGRLSGMPSETPDSQLKGKLQFHFCLLPHVGDVVAAKIANAAKRFLTPVESFQDSGYNRFSINRGPQSLQDEFSVLSFDSPLVVSAVKKAEDKDALVVRAFNPGFDVVDTGRFGGGALVKQVNQSDLAENTGKMLNATESLGAAQAQQVMTFLVELKNS
jgi:2-O-(6-phospho-alpha-D-mannosyl)-D-glycerate hydrolase